MEESEDQEGIVSQESKIHNPTGKKNADRSTVGRPQFRQVAGQAIGGVPAYGDQKVEPGSQVTPAQGEAGADRGQAGRGPVFSITENMMVYSNLKKS